MNYEGMTSLRFVWAIVMKLSQSLVIDAKA